MNSLRDMETRDFRTVTETKSAPSQITTRLLGSAETESMDGLDALLKSIHSVAVANRVEEVIVDMRELEFMNSSCFKTFVSWISALQDAEGGAKYKIRFLSDKKKHWQKRSLNALACFAVDLTAVETS